jgi:hypothetical protein
MLSCRHWRWWRRRGRGTARRKVAAGCPTTGVASSGGGGADVAGFGQADADARRRADDAWSREAEVGARIHGIGAEGRLATPIGKEVSSGRRTWRRRTESSRSGDGDAFADEGVQCPDGVGGWRQRVVDGGGSDTVVGWKWQVSWVRATMAAWGRLGFGRAPRMTARDGMVRRMGTGAGAGRGIAGPCV